MPDLRTTTDIIAQVSAGFGEMGRSPESKVGLVTAQAVEQALSDAGYVVVPMEPTKEQRRAIATELRTSLYTLQYGAGVSAYKAAVAASPFKEQGR